MQSQTFKQVVRPQRAFQLRQVQFHHAAPTIDAFHIQQQPTVIERAIQQRQ
jgi:hypothetical protein